MYICSCKTLNLNKYMVENCKFCGSKLEDGKCPNDHSFKKMCLNCSFVGDVDGSVVCLNEDIKAKAKEKVMAAIESATLGTHKITNIKFELEPVPLKKPTLKCDKWELNQEVLDEVKAMFK